MLFALMGMPSPESRTRRQFWFRASIAGALLLASACGSNAPLKNTGAGGSAKGSASGGADGATGGSAGGAAGSAAGSSGGSAGDAAGSAGAGPCPSQPPIAATSCNVASLICEYGADPNPFCRTYARCEQGLWQLAAVSMTECPSTTATTCPTTLEAARDTACNEKGAWCTWAPGTTCKCTDCRPGPTGDYCTGNPTWHCAKNSAGCPVGIPPSGSLCSGDQPFCTYGCEYGTRRCTAGIWEEEPGLCPMSTRTVKEDIRYLSPAEIDQLAAQTEAMRVASYRYRGSAFGTPGRHLGFIIEDSPDVPAVSSTHKTVDLYGFASMLLATSQAQARRIDALEREVARLRKRPSRASHAGPDF
ncbi:MAG: hypothetical protein QOI66_1754 [Myxococcales bacterium]|nr:hypothetical protein [Myxococcales bacterium]